MTSYQQSQNTEIQRTRSWTGIHPDAQTLNSPVNHGRVRFVEFRNKSVDLTAYPMLVDTDGSLIWHGRACVDDYCYKMLPEESRVVDIADAVGRRISTDEDFEVGFNVVRGLNRTNSTCSFTFDPNSKRCAVVDCKGGHWDHVDVKLAKVE